MNTASESTWSKEVTPSDPTMLGGGALAKNLRGTDFKE